MSDSWDKRCVLEAEAKKSEAEAKKAEAEAKKIEAEVESVITDAECKRGPTVSLIVVACKAVGAVAGPGLGIHMTWASAIVAMSYIFGVLMTEILTK